MIKFTATILKFDEQGEKSGWTYVVIPAELAKQLKPNNKKSFYIKGKLDRHTIKQKAVLPMGEGDFILPLNAEICKAIGKRKGAQLQIQLALDESAFVFSKEMMECLEDEPKAFANFKKLNNSEQKYFSKWIDSAKTQETKAKRIVQMLNAMLKGYRYGEMIRSLKK